jgi:hypothetical protein
MTRCVGRIGPRVWLAIALAAAELLALTTARASAQVQPESKIVSASASSAIVFAVAYSPDGKQVLTGGNGPSIEALGCKHCPAREHHQGPY